MANSKDLTIDGELVRNLATLLQETGLTEIEYAVGERRIRVVRGAPAGPAVTLSMPGTMPPPAAASAETTELAGAVKAPMVGTAYLAPQPGAEAFVKLGDQVREGQTLLIIEAMKVMNQIRAPRAGRLARVFVEDAEPVEYGAALMLIE